MRLIAALLALVALPAMAEPPYDVQVVLTAPTSGGPVDSYQLLVNGAPRGALAVGVNSFPGLITADGTYVFSARASNAAGTVDSDPVTQTITSIILPGKPTIQVQITCDPCVITSQ
jgi:hypothetical protein